MTIIKTLQCLPLLFVAGLTGCAAAPQASLPGNRGTAMFQLDDHSWADLSDVQEIYFVPAGANGAPDNPARISLVHRGGGDSTFSFTYDNQVSATTAWKKLVKYLGGSLNETDWKAPEVKSPPPVPNPQLAGSSPEDDSYAHLRRDLSELTACRDDRLITAEEYDHGHDRTVANFIGISKRNMPYNAVCDGLHSELVQLQAAKKDHLIGDADEKELHDSILVRHNLAAQ